ncbi:TPA: hypothetical protein N0F65_012784 [Lagenidium giganteum]|uniref:Ion transport domain-containing protein n=1 Tax=Lagenidium giganteum TaxID=4803 RepID=A0AAV2YHM6_9STRA|nr:TPA: hypothetical protein N0F65_012784 [Lagenidium giganteum]
MVSSSVHESHSQQIANADVEKTKVVDDKVLVIGGRKRISSAKAFGCLSVDHPVRKACIRIATSRYFDAIIIVTITLNSAILALSDFSVVDSSLNPSEKGTAFVQGQLQVNVTSWQNALVNQSEAPFTTIFTVECVIKMLALGLYEGDGTYLRDMWNVLDLFVVIFSLVSILPNIPNVSGVRTIRVLRQLRSLSVIPDMRRLISALLKALPALGSVVILQFFVFTIFGILGVQLFEGAMNQRCRQTPYPVKLELSATGGPIWPPSEYWTNLVISDPAAYRCITGPNLDVPDNYTDLFNRDTSPWHTPQPCFWPVDENDQNLCTASNQPGNHHCAQPLLCGSNFDLYGNPRFNLRRSMDHPLLNSALNYGYTSFDNIGYAFFAIFQSITTAGWTSIMYMLMDSWTPYVSAIFFCALILFGSMFVMNLTLAVISDEFHVDNLEQKAQVNESPAVDDNSEKGTLLSTPRYPQVYALVSHRYFTNCIMLAIAANTIVLSLDHHPMSDEFRANLSIANFFLSTIFQFEMVVKLIGLGIRQYAADRFNLFDATIVVIGVFETILSPPSFTSSAGAPAKRSRGIVSALRSFRMFRVFKLARNWHSLRMMLELIWRSVLSIGNFAVLLFIFIYIYALIGLEFFGNTMHFDSEGYAINDVSADFFTGYVPRANFDTFLVSFVTVFQIITLDNWNNILYDGVRGNGFGAVAYFFSLVIIGNFIMMNLFLALLLDNFDTPDPQPDSEIMAAKTLDAGSVNAAVVPAPESLEDIDVADRTESTTIILSDRSSGAVGRMRSRSRPFLPEKMDVDDNEVAKPIQDFDDLVEPFMINEHATNAPSGQALIPNLRLKSQRRVELKGAVDARYQQTPFPQTPTLGPSRELVQEKRISSLNNKIVEQPDKAIPDSVNGSDAKRSDNSLFLLSKKNRFRRWCTALVANPVFDSCILMLITLSSLSLALDNPLNDPEGQLASFLSTMDSVFTVIFLLEMIMKIIAYGLVMNEDAYLRNGWNILDCFIVVLSVLMMATDLAGSDKSALSTKAKKNIHSLRSLRTLRAFRPLRVISRHPGLKLVVSALFTAIPAVLNVMFVCTLIYLMFSIFAVTFLKGTMRTCDSTTLGNLSPDQLSFLTNPPTWNGSSPDQQQWFAGTPCWEFANGTTPFDSTPSSRYICECWNGTWDLVVYEHFDNVAYAMMTFFEMSTTENWDLIMWAAVDVVDIDMQPVQNNQLMWTAFFVAFMLIGGFFVVNLLVGVIIDNFNHMKDRLGNDFLHTPEQKKWIEAQKAASRVGPIRVHKAPKHPFRRAVFIQVQRLRFEWFIQLCIIVNTVIMATQYVGQSPVQDQFMSVMNNLFSGVFTIEAAAKLTAYGYAYFHEHWNRFDFAVVVATLLSGIIEAVTGTNVRAIATIVRTIRVTRILRLVKASKSVRQILMTLYVSLPGLSNIAPILMLMLFIYATMGVQIFAKVELHDNIDSHGNFQDFGTAMLFLLRVMTGESWDFCMHDFAASTPGCDDDPPYNSSVCGFNNSEGCTPIDGCGTPISYLYFNTFTLLVSYVMLNLTIAPLFEPELLNEFQIKWAEIDPLATSYVRVVKLRVLVNILHAPLGKAGLTFNRHVYLKYMRVLQLPIYEGETVFFKDVLLAMTREMVKDTVASDPNALADIKPPEDDEPDRERLEFFAHQYFAVCTIQRGVADWLRTKRSLEAQYMEEYKSKLKKPSGRPKKVRDARVFPVTDI